MDTKPRDYIVIGAGSAGCVVAARLAENPDMRVTLIEAGGSKRPWFVRMPSAFYIPMNRRTYNWGYQAEPEATLDNRNLACPRGRGLGGSSAINGMVYVRGNARDFDGWALFGADGWDYKSVLPYFKKTQSAQGVSGPHPYQGHDGPLKTTDDGFTNPLHERFLKAADEAGYPVSEDLNGAQQEGFGRLPRTVHAGERQSAATVYLRNLPNLEILTSTHVTRILFDSHRACGVETQHSRLYADREVILAAGAIGSPQLLQLSGVGRPEHLTRAGIRVVHDLPGVGENLMDHLEVYVQQQCTRPISLYRNMTTMGKMKIGIEWFLGRQGLGTTNHFETGGFIRSSESVAYPDIQFHFLPVAMTYDGSHRADGHGFQAHVGPMLSPSRGHVRIRSANPAAHPEIRFNYMSDPEDWRVFRAAIRAARNVFSQSAFDDLRGPELMPGADADTDDDLDAFVRAHAESAYHPCGTCRMGQDDQAVVDSKGRVHGLDGLRVADASIFPRITNGNLNAPTIMAAEKIADLIKQETH